MPEDSYAVEIHLGVARRELLDRRDLIGDAVVRHVAVEGVVERLRAAGGSHRINLHDVEAKLRERPRVAGGIDVELPGADGADLRARVDVVDDRILPPRLDLRRTIEQSLEIRLPVA